MKQKLSTVCAFFAVIASASFSEAAISLLDGVTYTQNFNSLASSGSTSTTMPTDWVFSESGSNANTSYAIGTGSDNGGNTYSFGTSGNSDRALGGLLSGSLTPTFGASFKNDVGVGTIDLSISYTGEQWRLGTAGRADRIDFQYSTNASSVTVGTWIDFDSLDFSSPALTTTGAKNGNLAGNQTALSATITGLSVAPGATFWIRWTDFDASGSDDGLAVDDFSITAVPETSTSLLGAIGVIALLRRRR